MPSNDRVRVEVSAWRRAAIDAAGDRLFVVGDVHGCARQLSGLLGRFAELHDGTRASRLVFLGDVINRGPEVMRTLEIWSQPTPVPGVTRTHRLMGNHEQLLWLAARGGADAAEARRRFLALGGTDALIRAAQGTEPWTRLLPTLESHVRAGNLILVHAGLDPRDDPDAFLARPADSIDAIDGGRHWAWIDRDFLTWTGGFAGNVVVHGHTPPAKHRRWTGGGDPHVLRQDRLCLDGGTTVTGVVVGAQIEDRRYRIVRAGLSS